MKYDEAISEAYTGGRMRHAAMPEGVYIEHVFSRGLLKCWPVERPDLEPMRSSSDYRATPEDEAADWYELIRVPTPMTMPPGNPVSVREQAAKSGWGKPATQNTPEYVAAVEDLVGAKRSGWGVLGTQPVPKVEIEVKSVMVLKNGKWVRENPLTAEPEPAKWGAETPNKEPGKWGS